jgi:hypothetical protein
MGSNKKAGFSPAHKFLYRSQLFPYWLDDPYFLFPISYFLRSTFSSPSFTKEHSVNGFEDDHSVELKGVVSNVVEIVL